MPSRIREYLPARDNWLAFLLGSVSVLGLYAISRYNFLLFHCLAEAFSIVIAIAVFAIFWNTRQFLENGVYLAVGFGCLFAGIFDIIYIFAYPGMSVFPGAGGNIALQAKTVAQWFVSFSCLGAFAFLRRKFHQNLALLIYGGLSALALASIFYWRVFPDCYAEGVGQTRFESMGLVLSCCAYLGAVGLLIRSRHEFDRNVFRYLTAVLVVFFVEDFASAVATDINGFAKTVAHLCQIVALYFVYKAFVEVGVGRILRQVYDEQLQRHQAELAHVARLGMMGEVAASLAHELNQPLHAVKNYAYGSICRLEKIPYRDEELVGALEQIIEEASRAAEIIRRVKGFVQKREPRFAEVAVNGLVEEAVLLSNLELRRRHAEIVLELAEDLPAVVGDAIQIEQVIMNLVRNGLEAMAETPEENRRLKIKTLRHAENMIQVDVCDCGKGIGEADREKIFEPFFTTKPEGMGMGLAIGQSIIQSHRGRLWATANEDQGCTFHFTLPVG